MHECKVNQSIILLRIYLIYHRIAPSCNWRYELRPILTNNAYEFRDTSSILNI